jgi:hypothetical protein
MLIYGLLLAATILTIAACSNPTSTASSSSDSDSDYGPSTCAVNPGP